MNEISIGIEINETVKRKIREKSVKPKVFIALQKISKLANL